MQAKNETEKVSDIGRESKNLCKFKGEGDERCGKGRKREGDMER